MRGLMVLMVLLLAGPALAFDMDWPGTWGCLKSVDEVTSVWYKLDGETVVIQFESDTASGVAGAGRITIGFCTEDGNFDSCENAQPTAILTGTGTDRIMEVKVPGYMVIAWSTAPLGGEVAEFIVCRTSS